MKVWVVFLHCGACGEYVWGGVYDKEEKAQKKVEEIDEEYCQQFHKHMTEAIECEVE